LERVCCPMSRAGSFINIQESGSVALSREHSSRSVLLSEIAIEEHPRLVTSRYAFLAQFVMLLVALMVYTAGPLLVNWAAVVPLPAEAEFTSVSAAAHTDSTTADEWFGVILDHRPGRRTLFVANVSSHGLAHTHGVLPGDIVARGWQGDKIIFTSQDFTGGDRGARVLKEVVCFVNTPGDKKPQCDLEIIDASKGLQIDFDMAHVDVTGGEPYLQVGIIFIRNLVGGLLLTLVSFGYGVNFRTMFNSRILCMLLFLGVGRAASDVFEIMANGKINAALYSIVSQTRLLGAAGCARCMLGVKFTTLQLLLLTSISVIIFCYIQVPDSVALGKYWNGFGNPRDPNVQEPEKDNSVGMMYALIKTALAVLMGVVGQKVLQDPSLKAFPMVALQAALFMISIVPLFVVTMLYMWAVNWPYGFFGGAVVEFRHCMKDWPSSKCAAMSPVALVEQGWDSRTIIVLMFYIMRESIVNSLVRMFSALAKDLVNASATVATYFLSIALLGKQFNMAKCGLVLVVVFQVMQYTLAPKYEEEPIKEEPKEYEDRLNRNRFLAGRPANV